MHRLLLSVFVAHTTSALGRLRASSTDMMPASPTIAAIGNPLLIALL
jgi:hypothetical protein